MPWRGNVRELENCHAPRGAAGRAATTIEADGRSQPGAARRAGRRSRRRPAPPRLVGRTVAEVERDLIIDTLRHTLGNRTHAADILGISIRTLRNKLREYGDEGAADPAARAAGPHDGDPAPRRRA